MAPNKPLQINFTIYFGGYDSYSMYFKYKVIVIYGRKLANISISGGGMCFISLNVIKFIENKRHDAN